MDDPIDAVERETVGVGPPDADRPRPERQRLDDVGSRANPRVEQHRRRARRRDDARQHVDRRHAAVGLAAAMVGAIDPVNAAVDGPARIVRMANAFEDQRQFCERSQPGQVGPGQRLSENS